uniref:pyridoxal kinase n=1 Tax=Otus sunia TaxID=257818 RepID=A0A8C8ANF7_9STRI
MEPERECRVLSIQSHVVRGYVGNKAATFPLQVSRRGRALRRRQGTARSSLSRARARGWRWGRGEPADRDRPGS